MTKKCAHTATNQLTKSEAVEMFKYEDGYLYWLNHKRGRVLNKPAGGIHNRRIQIVLNYKLFLSYVLIWNFHNGLIPDGYCIDHIDRDFTNNDINNLRLVTHSQNNRNMNTTTGYYGITNQTIKKNGSVYRYLFVNLNIHGSYKRKYFSLSELKKAVEYRNETLLKNEGQEALDFVLDNEKRFKGEIK